MTGEELYVILISLNGGPVSQVPWSTRSLTDKAWYNIIAAKLELAGTAQQQHHGLASSVALANQLSARAGYHGHSTSQIADNAVARIRARSMAHRPPTCRHCGAESKFAATDLAGLCWDCNEARR